MDNVEFREYGVIVVHRENGILVVVLVVSEPEQPITFNGSAQGVTGLAAGKKRRRILGIPCQTRISRKIVVPVIREPRSVNHVFASPGNDIDDSSSGCAGGEIKVKR